MDAINPTGCLLSARQSSNITAARYVVVVFSNFHPNNVFSYCFKPQNVAADTLLSYNLVLSHAADARECLNATFDLRDNAVACITRGGQRSVFHVCVCV